MLSTHTKKKKNTFRHVKKSYNLRRVNLNRNLKLSKHVFVFENKNKLLTNSWSLVEGGKIKKTKNLNFTKNTLNLLNYVGLYAFKIERKMFTNNSSGNKFNRFKKWNALAFIRAKLKSEKFMVEPLRSAIPLNQNYNLNIRPSQGSSGIKEFLYASSTCKLNTTGVLFSKILTLQPLKASKSTFKGYLTDYKPYNKEIKFYPEKYLVNNLLIPGRQAVGLQQIQPKSEGSQWPLAKPKKADNAVVVCKQATPKAVKIKRSGVQHEVLTYPVAKKLGGFLLGEARQIKNETFSVTSLILSRKVKKIQKKYKKSKKIRLTSTSILQKDTIFANLIYSMVEFFKAFKIFNSSLHLRKEKIRLFRFSYLPFSLQYFFIKPASAGITFMPPVNLHKTLDACGVKTKQNKLTNIDLPNRNKLRSVPLNYLLNLKKNYLDNKELLFKPGFKNNSSLIKQNEKKIEGYKVPFLIFQFLSLSQKKKKIRSKRAKGRQLLLSHKNNKKKFSSFNRISLREWDKLGAPQGKYNLGLQGVSNINLSFLLTSYALVCVNNTYKNNKKSKAGGANTKPKKLSKYLKLTFFEIKYCLIAYFYFNWLPSLRNAKKDNSLVYLGKKRETENLLLSSHLKTLRFCSHTSRKNTNQKTGPLLCVNSKDKKGKFSEVKYVSAFVKNYVQLPLYRRRYLYSKVLKGFIGKAVNSNSQLLFNTKFFAFSFNKFNSSGSAGHFFNSLGGNWSGTENIEFLLKNLFLSLSSIISRPTYNFRHDKLIIRLFLFLTPNLNRQLKTSLYYNSVSVNNKKRNKKVFRKRNQKMSLAVCKQNKNIKFFWKNKLKSQLKPLFSDPFFYRTAQRSFLNKTNNNKNYTLRNSKFNTHTANNKKDLRDISHTKKDNIFLLSTHKPRKIVKGKTVVVGMCKQHTNKKKNILPFAISSKRLIDIKKDKNKFIYLHTGNPVLPSISLLTMCKQNTMKKKIEAGGVVLYNNRKTASLLPGLHKLRKINWTRGSLLHFSQRKHVAFLFKKNKKGLEGFNLNIAHKNSYKNKNRLDYKFDSFFEMFSKNLEDICILLSRLLNKKVEIEIIKLQSPFHDSNILSQILGYNANRYNFKRLIRKVLPKAGIKNPSQDIFYANNKAEEISESKTAKDLYQPSSYLPALFSLSSLNSNFLKFKSTTGGVYKKHNAYLSGLKVRLAGRLMTQSMRPRFTVQTKQSGSLARVKVDFVEKSRFTGKNKRGTFSFTVTMSHVLTK